MADLGCGRAAPSGGRSGGSMPETCAHLDQVDAAAQPVVRGLRGLPARSAGAGCTCGCAAAAVTSAAATPRRTSTPPPTTPPSATRSISSFEPGEDWWWCFDDAARLHRARPADVLPPMTDVPSEPAAPPGATAGAARPVLLTVDDDPSVSRAVARDLRRRYGEEHRVVRATSGAEAPRDALRELKLRGEPGRGAAGRLPDAGDERHRVPRAGDGPVPAGPAGTADGVRRHRRGDRRHQRGRRRPLPAQAVGAAGGEALPGRRRDDRVLPRPPRTSRCARPR